MSAIKKVIQVDPDRCGGCGACVEACPAGLLALEEGLPRMTREDSCIACGHCGAVCASGALLAPKSSKAQPELPAGPVLDPELAERFLRSRRSIRRYQASAVPRETLLKLLDVARYAPSAINSQGVVYRVLDDPAQVRRVAQCVVDWAEEGLASGRLPAYFQATVDRARHSGEDVILRGAPALVLALVSPESLRGRDTARFALTYAELFAPSLGLGTCWAGYLEACLASGWPPLEELLQLPRGLMVGGALMVGVPDIRYHRLVEREPLAVTWQ